MEETSSAETRSLGVAGPAMCPGGMWAGLQIHGARRDAHHPCWERDLGLPLARELQTLGSTASEDHLEVCDNTGFPSPTDSPPLGGGARGFPKSGVISQEACQAQSHLSGPWPVDRMTGPWGSPCSRHGSPPLGIWRERHRRRSGQK